MKTREKRRERRVREKPRKREARESGNRERE